MKKPRQRRIRLILSFEAEVCLAADDNDVAPLGLAQDALGWITDVLEDFGSDADGGGPGFEVSEEAKNTAMGVHESGLVARPLVGAGAHRDGLWPVD